MFYSSKAATSGDESSYSSFYSSFLKTDEGLTSSNDEHNDNNDETEWSPAQKPPTKRPNPSWLENINLTNELVYQYKVDSRTLKDVLSADLFALKTVNQVKSVKYYNCNK